MTATVRVLTGQFNRAEKWLSRGGIVREAALRILKILWKRGEQIHFIDWLTHRPGEAITALIEAGFLSWWQWDNLIRSGPYLAVLSGILTFGLCLFAMNQLFRLFGLQKATASGPQASVEVVKSAVSPGPAAPSIDVSDPVAVTSPKNATGRAVRTWHLAIRNAGQAPIRNCYVIKSSFVNIYGKQSDSLNIRFKRSFEQAPPGVYEFSQSFDLPIGHSENIDIVVLDENDPKSKVHMLYAKQNVTALVGNAIPRRFFPHDLSLKVFGDGLLEPIERHFLLSVEAGYLRMTRVFGAPKPRNGLSFDLPQGDGRCITPTAFGQVPAIFVRLLVTNVFGRTLHNCRAKITGIQAKVGSKAYAPIQYAELVGLTWAMNGLDLDIRENDTAILDLIFARVDGFIGLPTQGFVMPNSLPAGELRLGRDYLLRVEVSSEETAAQAVDVEVQWGAVWNEIEARVYGW